MFKKLRNGKRGHSQTAIVIVLLLSFLLALSGGYMLGKESNHGDYLSLLDSIEITHKEIAVEKNKNKRLEEVLSAEHDRQRELLELVASLRAKPAEVKYIIRTETVLKPSDPVFITPDLPDEYLFALEDDIVVGKFTQRWINSNIPEYAFDTYELTFVGDLVVTDDKTAILLQVESSYSPGTFHDVPVTMEVTEITDTDRKLIEPHIGMGLTTSAIPVDVTLGAYSTLVHPTENLDLLGLRVGINKETVRFGIDPIGYNIGSQLPVFTDLWVYAGASTNLELEPTIDLTIGTKF